MASPTCEVQDGAGAFLPTINGVSLTPSGTFKIRLASTADVDSWAITCLTTDELGDPAAVDAALVIDPVLKTATGATPVAGRAMLFQSQVNGGVDRNNVRQPSYKTTFALYTPLDALRVHAIGETVEGNSVAGWGADVNAMIRAIYALNNPASPPVVTQSKATASDFTNDLVTSVDTNLSFNVLPGEVWKFEIKATTQCSGSGGVKFRISAPVGSSIEGWIEAVATAATSVFRQRIVAVNTLGSAAHAGAASPAPDKIWGVVQVGVDEGGVVALGVASVTAGQVSKVFAKASIVATRVTLE